jgi:hypothetical protein
MNRSARLGLPSTRGSAARLALVSAAAIIARPSSAHADRRLTITEAIEFALAHHPSLAARAAVEAGAAARTDGARASELPDLALVGQVNRASGKVVPGSQFAMRGLPGLSGASTPARTRAGSRSPSRQPTGSSKPSSATKPCRQPAPPSRGRVSSWGRSRCWSINPCGPGSI